MGSGGARRYRPGFFKVFLFCYPVFLVIFTALMLAEGSLTPLDFLWFALALAPMVGLLALVIVLSGTVLVSGEGITVRPGLSKQLIHWEAIRSARPSRFLMFRYAKLGVEGAPQPLWLSLDLNGGSPFTDDLLQSAPAGNPLRVLLETGVAAAAEQAGTPAALEDPVKEGTPAGQASQEAQPQQTADARAELEKEVRAKLTRESQFKGGANWFFWIAGLSMFSTIALLFGWEYGTVAGLAVTQAIDGVMLGLAQVIPEAAALLRGAGVVLNAVIAGLFVLFGVFARKKHGWSFVTGMALYAMDTVLCLVFGDYLSAAFHAFALYGLYTAYRIRKTV